MVLRLNKLLKLESEYIFHAHFGFKTILLFHVKHLEKTQTIFSRKTKRIRYEDFELFSVK